MAINALVNVRLWLVCLLFHRRLISTIGLLNPKPSQLCKKVGVISDPQFPTDLEGWTNELSQCKQLKPPKLWGNTLLVHGSDDRLFPHLMPRLADAHGSADLRIIDGATHRLRFDPEQQQF